MKKKQGIVIAIIVTIIVLIVVGYNIFTKVNKINDLVDLNSVNNIAIVNGSNGNIVELSDVEEKKGVVSSLDKLKLRKIDSDDSTGWSFAILVKTDKSEVKITFIDKETCSINGSEYSIENVDTNILKFYDKE